MLKFNPCHRVCPLYNLNVCVVSHTHSILYTLSVVHLGLAGNFLESGKAYKRFSLTSNELSSTQLHLHTPPHLLCLISDTCLCSLLQK